MTDTGYTYDYPRPMVTVDAVVFAVRDAGLSVALIERKNPPFAGAWALPGGFVEMDEPLRAAAARELAEETGLTRVRLEQFHAFGDPGRDPRGRSIAVAYWGVIDASRQTLRAGDDAAAAQWHRVNALPELAFDHRAIMDHAVRVLRIAAEGPSDAGFLPVEISMDVFRRAVIAAVP